ncbi:MAG TPA: hypothetical protein VKB62_04050 [Streptosporangiaceae bacterium]|nr:hypothetical protein [Streptosporangiaceae bacterium]
MSYEPVGTTMLFENDRVRVWEMRLAPGETCTPHRHAHDYLMMYTIPSVIASGPAGQEMVQQLDPGMIAFSVVGADGLGAHAITNVGDEDSHHFVVELLGPSSSPTPLSPAHNGRGRVLPPR